MFFEHQAGSGFKPALVDQLALVVHKELIMLDNFGDHSVLPSGKPKSALLSHAAQYSKRGFLQDFL